VESVWLQTAVLEEEAATRVSTALLFGGGLRRTASPWSLHRWFK
jgi:hypothetical protein